MIYVNNCVRTHGGKAVLCAHTMLLYRQNNLRYIRREKCVLCAIQYGMHLLRNSAQTIAVAMATLRDSEVGRP